MSVVNRPVGPSRADIRPMPSVRHKEVFRVQQGAQTMRDDCVSRQPRQAAVAKAPQARLKDLGVTPEPIPRALGTIPVRSEASPPPRRASAGDRSPRPSLGAQEG
jgi:hypothetical protein